MFYQKNFLLDDISNYRFFLHFIIEKTKSNPIENETYNLKVYKQLSLKISDEKLYEYFLEGKNVHIVISKSYSEFIDDLNYLFIYRPDYNPNGYRNAFYITHKGIDFRQKMKFVKNNSTINYKKNKNFNKKQWREYKGFYKDKAKRNGKRHEKPNKKFKQCRNRAFRRAMNDLLKNNDFDKIDNKLIKLYYDLWDWF